MSSVTLLRVTSGVTWTHTHTHTSFEKVEFQKMGISLISLGNGVEFYSARKGQKPILSKNNVI